MAKELTMRNGEVVDADTGEPVTPEDVEGELTLVTPAVLQHALAEDAEDDA